MTAKTTPPPEPNLRTTFTALADRYEHLAATTVDHIGPARARHITRTAADIRTVLATGHIPTYLRPSATTVEEDAS